MNMHVRCDVITSYLSNRVSHYHEDSVQQQPYLSYLCNCYDDLVIIMIIAKTNTVKLFLVNVLCHGISYINLRFISIAYTLYAYFSLSVFYLVVFNVIVICVNYIVDLLCFLFRVPYSLILPD